MSAKKNLSLFERIRLHLGLRPSQMAEHFNAPRQWYSRRQRASCFLTVHQLAHLHRLSGMTPEQFLAEIQAAAATGARKADRDLK